MRAILVLVGVWLTALTVAAITPHATRSETSCTRIIHAYLHTAAEAAGVTLHHEKILACRNQGNEAVARVEFDATLEAYGVTQHEVLAVRLVKSEWWVTDAHVVAAGRTPAASWGT